jgi:hypothetical protein
MENIEPIYFNNLAYVQSKVSSDVLEELKNEAKFILENQSQFQKFNNGLAGNLEKEYSTDKSKEILAPDLITLANEYHKNSQENKHYKHSQENKHYPNWKIKDLWINFQKKYEHNPMHNHTGDLSFVLWITIPYDLKDELSLPNCKNSNTPVNSLFEFICTDFLGRVVSDRIDVDKTYEGTIVMFPSALNHTVHPFYTSDEYRISISGNLVAAPPKSTFSYQ